jgi:anti-sigma factor RsiW
MYPAVIRLANSTAPVVVGAYGGPTGKTVLQARLCTLFKRAGLQIAGGPQLGSCYAATAAALSLRRMLNHRMML